MNNKTLHYFKYPIIFNLLITLSFSFTVSVKIVDENTIVELSTFVAKGQSYEANIGNHDDLVMNLVMFGYFISPEFFADMTNIDLKQILFDSKMK